MNAPHTGSEPAPGDPRKLEAPPLVDLGHLLLVLRERWLGALGLAVLVSGLVGFLLLSRPAVYTASARLLLERSGDRVVDFKQVVDNTVEGNLTDAMLLSHIEQIQGSTLTNRVIQSFSEEERRELLSAYAESDAEELARPVGEALDEAVRKHLNETLTVERLGRTLLIKLAVKHRDPAWAQRLANRFAEQYIAHLGERTGVSNDAAQSFLHTQAEQLRTAVEKAEKTLQDFRAANNLVAIEDNQSITTDRLKQLGTQVTEKVIERIQLETRLNQAKAVLESGGDARVLAGLKEFEAFSEVQREIDALAAQRTAQGERYGRRHPRMIEMASQREALERLRADRLLAGIQDLENQLSKSTEQASRLSAEYAAAEQESLRLDRLAAEYAVLERSAETERKIYDEILNQRNQTVITSQIQSINIKLVDRALLPEKPTEPNRLKVALVMCLLFGGCFLGYPLTADLLDNRVKSAIDVETYLGASLLAEVTHVGAVPEAERARIVVKHTDEAIEEAFRGLYSQLQLSSRCDMPKTLLVTSTVPGEGKSFVVANLAATFAAHGKRVLVIDGDFRRPSVHKAFGIDNSLGCLTALEGRLDGKAETGIGAFGVRTLAENLSVLTTGGVSRRITELLENERLTGMFETLQRSFDLILLDTPPAGVFPDAEALTRVADEILYVCRFGKTERPQARQILARLAKTNIPIVGVVLNAMPAGRRGAHYYSGYGYYGARYYKEYAEEKRKA